MTGGRPNLWFMNIGKAALYSALDNAHRTRIFPSVRALSARACTNMSSSLLGWLKLPIRLCITQITVTTNLSLNISNHSFIAEAEICQLADIQDSIQRMREGDLCPPLQDRQSVEARLSSSCPSLIVESGDEAGLTGDQAATPGVSGGQLSPSQHRRGHHRGHGGPRPGRQRPGRARSPSVSTGESDEDTVSDNSAPRQPRQHQLSMGVAPGPGGGAGLHKSVSTPSMVAANENIGHSATPSGKQG